MHYNVVVEMLLGKTYEVLMRTSRIRGEKVVRRITARGLEGFSGLRFASEALLNILV